MLLRITDYRENHVGSSWLDGLRSALSIDPVPLLLILYAVVPAVLVYALGGFHHGLIYMNRTTNEHLKNTFRRLQGNPFRGSYFYNVASLLFRSYRPRWEPSAPFDRFM